MGSLRKQPTFGEATSGFPAKFRPRNERRNSILMMHHFPDLGSASDWLNQISHVAWPIRSTTQIWVEMCHQYGISVLFFQTSFGGETSGSMAKCRLFSQARWQAGKERVALLSFPLMACLSLSCSLALTSLATWNGNLDHWLQQVIHFLNNFCMGLWLTFVCDAANKRHRAETPSCVPKTSLTLVGNQKWVNLRNGNKCFQRAVTFYFYKANFSVSTTQVLMNLKVLS